MMGALVVKGLSDRFTMSLPLNSVRHQVQVFVETTQVFVETI